MWMQRLLAMELLVGLIASASADTMLEQCRRRCGSDEECFRICIATRTEAPPPRHYHHHHHHHHHHHAYTPRYEKDSILESGYDFLYAKATEADGYGLFSYVILPSVSDRAAALLDEVFKSFPPASALQTPRIRTNILYIPTKEDSRDKFNLSADASREAVRVFLSSHYDLSKARLLLDHLCDKPAEEVRQLCQNDLTGGPYILTYASKISDLSPLPPPFLFVDLTNVHQRAFGQFVSAYRSQVKSPKFSDRAKIDTFRLTLLNVTLTFADWVQPISAAVADIIHQANPKEKPKTEKR
jgi:hypothetical protein